MNGSKRCEPNAQCITCLVSFQNYLIFEPPIFSGPKMFIFLKLKNWCKNLIIGKDMFGLYNISLSVSITIARSNEAVYYVNN